MTSKREPVKILAPQSFRAKLAPASLVRRWVVPPPGRDFLAACGAMTTELATRLVAATTTVAPRLRRHRRAERRRAVTAARAGVAPGDYSRVVNKSVGTLGHVHLGRVQRPRHRRRAGRDATRRHDEGRLLRQQRRPDHQARGVEGHQRVRHRRADRAVHPADDRRRTCCRSSTSRSCPTWSTSIPLYLGQRWDPNNEYSVCKDWGSTGWIYDTTVITRDSPPGTTSSMRAWARPAANCSVLDTARQRHRHVLLGQRHQLDHRGGSRSRRVREVPGRRVRPAHQGVRLLSVRPRSPRARTSCRWSGTATPARPTSASPTPAATRRLGVGARLAGDRAVDGQLLHRRRRPEPRGRARLDQLDAEPEVVDQGPRLPRLQQRMKDMAELFAELCPTCVRRHDLLHRRAGRDDGDRRGQLRAGPPGRDLQQGQGRGRQADRRDGGGAWRRVRAQRRRSARRTPARRRRRSALAIPSIVWYVFFFVLPIVLIVVYSFGVKNRTRATGVPVEHGQPDAAELPRRVRSRRSSRCSSPR